MDIALSLVGLHDKEVGHMPADVVLVTGSIAAEDLLQSVTKSASNYINPPLEKGHTSESSEAPGRSLFS